jgi:hypothetical protein
MPRYKACDPPCTNQRCYPCNATARDLALKAKAAGGSMRDLPDWAQYRVRRMAGDNAAAQNLSQAYDDARTQVAAFRSYAARMKASDTDWVCASCEKVQSIDTPRHVQAMRRYCPTCAAPLLAADASRLSAAREAEAVLAAIKAGNPLETIYARGKANWTTDERVALVAAHMICVHCACRIGQGGVPAAGPSQKHCAPCYMAREYGERATASASARSVASIANVAGVLADASSAQAAKRAEDDAPRKDRFELIDIDDTPSAPADKPAEPSNPDDRFLKIELD